MKKPFFETIVGKIVKVLIGIALKKAPFNKTEKDEKRIDDILDKIP